jgi:hypothetical protein
MHCVREIAYDPRFRSRKLRFFCERECDLERRGVRPNLTATSKRAARSAWHRRDRERVAAAPWQHRAGIALIAAAVIALLVMIMLALAIGLRH